MIKYYIILFHGFNRFIEPLCLSCHCIPPLIFKPRKVVALSMIFPYSPFPCHSLFTFYLKIRYTPFIPIAGDFHAPND